MSDQTKPPLPTAIAAKWNAAAEFPNTPIDMGDVVVCDLCNADWRGKPDSGGLIFQSKAVCPACAPQFMVGVTKHREQAYIRATCPDGVSFQQFVLDYRARHGGNTITVLTGLHAEQAMRPIEWRPLTPEQKRAVLLTDHVYGCNCDVCLTWWALMGPDGGEPDSYGPFKREQVNERQREIGREETP
jgi:hypothetical protein